jgi:hypothetical protein
MTYITRLCVASILLWSALHLFFYFIYPKNGAGQINPEVAFDVLLNASCPEMKHRDDIQSLVIINQIVSLVSFAAFFVWCVWFFVDPRREEDIVAVLEPNDLESFKLKSHKITFHEAMFHLWATIFFIWFIFALSSYVVIAGHHKCKGKLYLWFFGNLLSFEIPIVCVSGIYWDGYNQALLKQEEEKNKDDVSFNYKLLDEENHVPHLSKC